MSVFGQTRWQTASPAIRHLRPPHDMGFLSADEVLVPAGEFQMGCIAGGDCYPDEQPRHTVYLDDYIIDKYEVTNAQHKACVDARGCSLPAFNYSRTRDFYYGNPAYADYPVIYVSWFDAAAYCMWVGKGCPPRQSGKRRPGEVATRACTPGETRPRTVHG